MSVDLTAREPDEAGQRRDRWSSERFEVDADDAGNDARPGDVWIELEIEPLFPSSDAAPQHLVDLTEENDPEPTA